MGAAKRRRRQMVMNNAHLTGPGVSRYKRPNVNRNVQEAIAAERNKAAREAAAKRKAKK